MKKAIIIALATVTLSLFTMACGESEADKLIKQEMKIKAERAAKLEKIRKIAESVRREFKDTKQRQAEFDKRMKVDFPDKHELDTLLTNPDFAKEAKFIVLSLLQ